MIRSTGTPFHFPVIWSSKVRFISTTTAHRIPRLAAAIMSDKPFFSILTLTFASEGDLRIWRDKIEVFSNEKAIAYLKQHGQRSLTIIETRENDTIKGVAIWEYESHESREASQAYWSKWFDFDGKFIAKSTFVRGEKTFGW